MKTIVKKLCIFLFFLFLFRTSVRADYVLPYPSYMPGNKLYKVSRIFDQIMNWWYWGSISSLKYHLQLSDKYLVEAKTLFEYKQYFFALDALERSDSQFLYVGVQRDRASNEGKDMTQFTKIVKDAAVKHIDVLMKLHSDVPEEFLWAPEKEKPIRLDLSKKLRNSIAIRQRLL